MEGVLEPSLVQISPERLEWREAIALAAEPLLTQGYIEERYIQAMIQTVEEMGAYIVLAPKTAVPHARPEAGARKTGISLLKLDHPVDFNVDNETDPDRLVQLVFVLAAKDNHGHLGALMSLSQLLDEDSQLEELIHCTTVDQLVNVINKYTEKDGEQDD